MDWITGRPCFFFCLGLSHLLDVNTWCSDFDTDRLVSFQVFHIMELKWYLWIVQQDAFCSCGSTMWKDDEMMRPISINFLGNIRWTVFWNDTPIQVFVQRRLTYTKLLRFSGTGTILIHCTWFVLSTSAISNKKTQLQAETSGALLSALTSASARFATDQRMKRGRTQTRQMPRVNTPSRK